MECKVHSRSPDPEVCCMCINRNIVECKGNSSPSFKITIFSVLIETLWNVKAHAWPYSALHCSINRNIVECKALIPGTVYRTDLVLIETLWNVKLIPIRLHPPFRLRINRNIVECKVYYKRSFSRGTSSINRNIVECKEIFLDFY